MKRCGLYTRVSTEDQAQVKDGSLETQMDLLERHVQLKADSTDETWRLVIRVKPSVAFVRYSRFRALSGSHILIRR